MKVHKLSISLDPDLGDQVRAAAESVGLSVSAWLAEAAAAQLRHKALHAYLDDWQAEHGKISPARLAKAKAKLGRPRRGP
jgi:hypothetical protein